MSLTSVGAVRSGKRICAIHQPNFFPWLGYFDKIRRADVFVFLDDVIYPKSGAGMGTWSNRVWISIQGRQHWFGCPVVRYSGTKQIHEVQIASDNWREKNIRTLEMNYRRYPNFKRAMQIVEPLIRFESSSLAEFNINAIKAISSALDLRVDFLRQSELAVGGAATDLLCRLTNAVGADAYLCGGGAAEYQQDEMFAERGLDLIYQAFVPIPYREPFLPGLSVIDFLMTTDDPRKGFSF